MYTFVERYSMAKCPNCGQSTSRTGDWACPWCGYPLLSGSHKKIPKTYQQLKAERQPEHKLPEIEPVSAPEPEPAPKPKPKPRPKSKPEPEPTPELEPEPEPEPEPTPELEPEPAPEPEPVSEPEPISEPVSAEIELTAAELFSAYEADGVAADARFVGKILKLSGAVHRIESKDTLDIHYVSLTSTENNLSQEVRCMFDNKHRDDLNQLTPGQMVTVQGKYDGSIINFRMIDCAFVH